MNVCSMKTSSHCHSTSLSLLPDLRFGLQHLKCDCNFRNVTAYFATSIYAKFDDNFVEFAVLFQIMTANC